MSSLISKLELFENAWRRLCDNYSRKEPLHEAILYALAGNGKRVRPLCAMIAAEHYGQAARVAVSAACAIEMIHTYSFVHDDLPCLDNDVLRRGRPTVHKVFDEATALLVGDALLTDSFRVLTDAAFFPDNAAVSASDQVKQVSLLAKAAGGHGMVLGQARDVWWTGRGGITQDALESIHTEKTGALMGASFALGAVAAGATRDDAARWENFGRSIGLAFQAVDDTLDGSRATGKSSGKDLAQGKLTYLRFQTREEIMTSTLALTSSALQVLPVPPSNELREFVERLVYRVK